MTPSTSSHCTSLSGFLDAHSTGIDTNSLTTCEPVTAMGRSPTQSPKSKRLRRSSPESLPALDPHCNCLQEQMNLLVRLKGMVARYSDSFGIDAVLLGVSQAFMVWHSYLKCPTCSSPATAGGTIECLTFVSLSASLAFQLVQTQLCLLHQTRPPQPARDQYSYDLRPMFRESACRDQSNSPSSDSPLMSLGNYTSSASESRLLSTLLLFRATTKFGTVLRLSRSAAAGIEKHLLLLSTASPTDTGSILGGYSGQASGCQGSRVPSRLHTTRSGDYGSKNSNDEGGLASLSNHDHLWGDRICDGDSLQVFQVQQVQRMLRRLEEHVRDLRGWAGPMVGEIMT